MNEHEKLKEIYDGWYKNNRHAIQNEEWKITNKQLLENPESDSLRGINLLAYVSSKVNRKIDSDLVPLIKTSIGSSGWIFPSEGRHITILDIVPHNSGIDPSELDGLAFKYKENLDNLSYKGDAQIKISLEGIFASTDGITIQGYSLNSNLSKLRENLRTSISKSGLSNLENNKYKIETAHVALVKFTSNPNVNRLLELVDGLRDIELGEFNIEEIVLNISSRYDKSKTIKVIKNYFLR